MDRRRRPFRVHRPSRRQLLIAGAAFTAAVFLAVGVAALVLPGMIRAAAEERLQARLTAPARIGKVNLNLFTGRARLSDIAVEGTAGEQPILRLAALDLEVSYRALLRGTVVLRYLTFREPKLFIERTGPESVNVLQVMRPTESGDALGVTVEQVHIEDGVVTFVDRTQRPAFERTFTGLHLTAGTLSTLPELRLTPTSFELRLGIGRGALTITGATAPFGRPAGIELTARMEKLDPGLLKGYLPLRARMDLRESWVDGEVRYRLAYRGDQAIENAMTAEVDTGPIRFLPPDDDTPLVSVGGLAGRDIAADFLRNRVRLGNIVVRDPNVKLERRPDGVFTVTRLLAMSDAKTPAARPPPPGETRQSAAPAAPGPELSLVVGRARVEGGRIEFIDQTTKPVVATSLRELTLTVRDVSLGPGARPGRVEAEARVEQGRVAVAGTVEGGTFTSRARLTASGLPLLPFRGYLEQGLPNAIARGGVADARLDIVLAPRAASGVRLDLTGRLEGRRIALALPNGREPVLRADRLAVDFARLVLAPTVRADLAAVRLSGATLWVTRDREGNLDVLRLWSRNDQPIEAPVSAAGESGGRAPSPVAIRRVELRDSGLHFIDRAVTPAFEATLTELRADVRQTPEPERMALRVEGRLDGSASLELAGWITPFAQPLRLAVDGAIRDYELDRLNPYAVSYVSHRIDRGRVTTEVQVRYDGGRYSAESDIRIRHIQLGQDLGDEFGQRVGIPLSLAVSLLEDRHGEIRLRIPVSGDAEGRQVHLKPVIWDAIRGAVIKLVAAPFRLFGSVLTLGGKIGQLRIEPIGFRPGSLEPDDPATERFAELVEFLRDKPRLALELSGTATRDEVEPLRRERLRQKLKKMPETGEGPLVAAYHDAGGPARRDPPSHAEMEEYILAHTDIADEDLRRLAEERARVIQEALVRRGVQRGQLFVATRGERALTGGERGHVEVDILR